MLKILISALIPFLFISCQSPYLDMSGVSGGLNKETYKKGEDIVLTCKGSFRPEDEQDEGSILLSFCIYKVIDGKKDYENLVAYKIIDYGKMEYKKQWYRDYRHFRGYIRRISRMTPFKETVTIRIEDEGEYILFFGTSAVTSKKPRGGSVDDEFPFKITK